MMATKKTLAFKLGDKLKITRSGELGIVFGRATYVDSNPQFLLRYCRADGVAADGWFHESEVELVEPATSEPEQAAA